MQSFYVALPIIFTFFASCTASYKLVLKQIVPSAPVDGQFMRGYAYYTKPNGRLFTIECSLPPSYNETVSGKANVYWEKERKSTLTIDPSRSGSVSAEYKCLARNIDDKPLPKYEDTVFKYYRSSDDVKIVPPSSSVLNYSDSSDLIFQCQVATDKISWYLDGNPLTPADKNIILYKNNTLVVKNPSYKSTGVYLCSVDDNLTRVAFYNIEGKPYFALKHGKMEDSENKLEEEFVTLEHELFGNPLKELQWFKKIDDDEAEIPIDADYVKNDPRFKFLPSGNVTNGILEISDLVKGDRAYYISRAVNQHGQSEFKTLVRVKGRLDALWPFLGIVAEVIILVAIILIYERRRLKRDAEADEAMDQKKPLTSTNNDSVRQRKN